MPRLSALVRFVSRVPARVRIKLLAAFLAIEALLIVMGAVFQLPTIPDAFEGYFWR
jgi:hypothetical protein